MGDDKGLQLRKAFESNLFQQLRKIKHITFEDGEKQLTKEILWYLLINNLFDFYINYLFRFSTGDMNFICGLFGHIGAAAAYPCLLCEAPSVSYKQPNISFPARTLDSITIAAAYYQSKNSDVLRQQDKTQLNKTSKAISMLPAVDIAVSQIIPSSLHIIQGLGQDLIKLMEKEADKLSTEEENRRQKLDDVYEQLGASQKKYFQKFTGLYK